MGSGGNASASPGAGAGRPGRRGLAAAPAAAAGAPGKAAPAAAAEAEAEAEAEAAERRLKEEGEAWLVDVTLPRLLAGAAAYFGLLWLVRCACLAWVPLTQTVPAGFESGGAAGPEGWWGWLLPAGSGGGWWGAAGAAGDGGGGGAHGVGYGGARLEQFAAEAEWKNALILDNLVPGPARAALGLDGWPRAARSYVRNYLMANLIYLGLGGVWAYEAYFVWGEDLFKPNEIPRSRTLLTHIKVSMQALPLYSALPVLVEVLVEKGYTMCFPAIGNYGVPAYLGFFALYMASVEFGVYWMHRLLHDIRPAYKALHYVHHIYNANNTLSPLAGLAFNPLDGILQAVPYAWGLFFIPMHFLTHELLLFATAVWTTNIHDCIDGQCEPIMGAAYHTIHHTTYKHNHGHYFIYMDKLFGTLLPPKRAPSQRGAASGMPTFTLKNLGQ